MMVDVARVVNSAQRLSNRSEVALEVLLGLRAKALETSPQLSNDSDLEPVYDGNLMGPLDEVRRLGRKILARWNQELHTLVCGAAAQDDHDRKAILDSLNLGEAAIIGAVAGALLSLRVPATLAAALAPLIVKRFIAPAYGELCDVWGEAIRAQD